MPQDPTALAALVYLAQKCGVKLDDCHLAIATPEQDAKMRTQDGSLDVTLASRSYTGCPVLIQAPRAPGVIVELVDHVKDPLAPSDAIYKVRAYTPSGKPNNPVGQNLNGEISSIYIGKNGIILDETLCERAKLK
ncbi:MAG TPA: hypothetical protein VJJ82_02565 [Candidatus Nanoarchaeia archaeon]|nr:hypothetical protein [Candidatus Nanoarchaeia archaeon]